MKLRILLVIVAIIVAAGAVFGVITYINSVKASVEEGVEKVEVLVASQNIPKEISVETLISAGMVEMKGIPRLYLAEGVLTSLEEYKGYVVAAPINEGEQITTTKFIKPEEVGLAFIVPEEMVAISIPVDEIIGVSNLIDVGDRVNVIATFFPEGEYSSGEVSEVEGEQPEEGVGAAEKEEASIRVEKDTTKILLWNVEVLYIGIRMLAYGETEGNGGIPQTQTEVVDSSATELSEIKTVTLAVTPEDSEKLIFSEEVGSVWLALVPTDGIEEDETTGVTIDNIFKE